MRAIICGKIEKKYIGSEKLIGKKDLTAILSFLQLSLFFIIQRPTRSRSS